MRGGYGVRSTGFRAVDEVGILELVMLLPFPKCMCFNVFYFISFYFHYWYHVEAGGWKGVFPLEVGDHDFILLLNRN